MCFKYRIVVIVAALAVFVLGFGAGIARAGTMLFADGFDSGTFANWDYVQPACGLGTITPHLTTVTSPVRQGTYAAQDTVSDSYKNLFGLEACEMEPGHHSAPGTAFPGPFNSTAGSYRLGQDDYYGVSYRFKSPWSVPYSFSAIGQFGYSANTEPPLLISTGSTNPGVGGNDIRLFIESGRSRCLGCNNSGDHEYDNWPGVVLVPNFAKDTWYDVILHVKWATGLAGAVDVWVRQEGAADFTQVYSVTGIPTQQWDYNTGGTPVIDINGNCVSQCPREAPYDKIGFYRGVSPSGTPDDTVYLDNFSYGTSYDVVHATFPGATAPAPPPSNTTQPAISGTAIAWSMLSASNGTWSGSPTSYAYQWTRCDLAGASCAPVSGATARAYTLGAGDVGATMRVAVTATNAGGSTSATSSPTVVVAASFASGDHAEPSPLHDEGRLGEG